MTPLKVQAPPIDLVEKMLEAEACQRATDFVEKIRAKYNIDFGPVIDRLVRGNLENLVAIHALTTMRILDDARMAGRLPESDLDLALEQIAGVPPPRDEDALDRAEAVEILAKQSTRLAEQFARSLGHLSDRDRPRPPFRPWEGDRLPRRPTN